MAKREAAQDAAVHAKGRTRERYQRSRAPGTKTLYFVKEQSMRLGRPRQVFFDTLAETQPMQTLEMGPATPPPILVAPSLSAKARVLYEALRDVGYRVSDARGYCAAVSVVHFFCPGEVVAGALCMARSTMYLKLAELRGAGLVEGRAHYITHKGRTRADGMVWAVKLNPAVSKPARVPYDALKKSYRCLSADIADGRTAFREIGQSRENSIRQVDTSKILAWALPPSTTQKPVTGMTVRADLEQVLDVPYAGKQDRNTAVDGAAQALAASLGDTGSVMFYRWLIWQLLRLSDRHQGDHWHQVYEMARRASIDTEEGFARKPGALFTSRLKQTPWWEMVRSLPLHRVGAVPTSIDVSDASGRQ